MTQLPSDLHPSSWVQGSGWVQDKHMLQPWLFGLHIELVDLRNDVPDPWLWDAQGTPGCLSRKPSCLLISAGAADR